MLNTNDRVKYIIPNGYYPLRELTCSSAYDMCVNCIYIYIYSYTYTTDFPKERYNTYAKSCNSNLYTKYPGATYCGLLLGTMRCL